MAKDNRLEKIVKTINEYGYISVTDLSRLLDVSEMTIRRDLAQLDEEKRIHRTYGGAAPRQDNGVDKEGELSDRQFHPKNDSIQVDMVDVLIATSVNPYYDKLLLDRVGKKNIPVIAESLPMPNQRTVVSVDNYQAGLDLGRATGNFMRNHDFNSVQLLDLSFQLPNTQIRSQGFIDGLNEFYPSHELVLSINAQSRSATAYQIAFDALSVHKNINLIFAINDTTALGAIKACQDLQIDSENMVVVTFGLEGDTMKNALYEKSYCKVGLAMFPEIVAQGCIDAAIGAFMGNQLPEQYITPHVILTPESLSDYYTRVDNGWQLNWESVHENLSLPQRLESGPCFKEVNAPIQIGLIIPFSEHEWYQELTHNLVEYANQCGANLHIIDADQNVQDEVEMRRMAIARKAASLIEPGNVILMDGGPMSVYLAEELRGKTDITVITNSMDVFNTLNPSPGIILISTGGAVRYSSQTLVGPTAESALKELRADKLFLMVGGISLDFGLSHTNISEVSIKQAMIRSAREIILLADHTSFSTESIIQVAPLSIVNILITDDALPSSIRLNLTKLGIRIILA